MGAVGMQRRHVFQKRGNETGRGTGGSGLEGSIRRWGGVQRDPFVGGGVTW